LLTHPRDSNIVLVRQSIDGTDAYVEWLINTESGSLEREPWKSKIPENCREIPFNSTVQENIMFYCYYFNEYNDEEWRTSEKAKPEDIYSFNLITYESKKHFTTSGEKQLRCYKPEQVPDGYFKRGSNYNSNPAYHYITDDEIEFKTCDLNKSNTDKIVIKV
jgi:hypothetical protein